MTFIITSPCIDTRDQACVEVCPVDCIHFDESADRMLYINPAECIDCGACQPACPVNAIFAEADVPADQHAFIALNALWYDDPATARAQVGGGAAAAPEPVAAPAAAPAASTAEVETAPAATEATAPTAAESAPVAAAAAPATPAAAPVIAHQVEAHQVEAHQVEAHQVEALPPHVEQGVVLPLHRLPSPLGLVSLAAAGTMAVFMILTPGPTWIELGDLDIPATVLILAPLFALFNLLFLINQVNALSDFAAHHPSATEPWRWKRADWRRSEEHRRYELTSMVRELAHSRFAYPSEAYPALRTHVNVPDPTMAVEFGGGGGEKVFPDILVVEYPGNYPRLIAQIETRETVTREQAERVWAKLESKEAPLYLYVPSGYAKRAKDYARAAGLKNVKLRTWRRQPTGLLVQELN